MNSIKGCLKVLGLIAMSLTAMRAWCGVEYVTIEGVGSGATMNAAVWGALTQAVTQVNGIAVAAKAELTLRNMELAPSPMDAMAEGMNERLSSATRGLVQSYRVLEKGKDPARPNLWAVRVSAQIAHFEEDEQSHRIRLAIMPFRIREGLVHGNAAQYERILTDNLTAYLTHTRKFAVLDRDYINERGIELDTIRRGIMPVEELARLGNKLATDYMIVGTIEEVTLNTTTQTLPATGQKITNAEEGARISYRVVDVATGQIKYANDYDHIDAIASGKSDLGRAAKRAGLGIGDVIINAIFPVRIEAVDSDYVYLGSGGLAVKKGERYRLIALGDLLRDSYTGESLGNTERDVGMIEVVDVQAKQSRARIVKSSLDVRKDFEPGKFIVRAVTRNANQPAMKETAQTANDKADALEKSSDKEW